MSAAALRIHSCATCCQPATLYPCKQCTLTSAAWFCYACMSDPLPCRGDDCRLCFRCARVVRTAWCAEMKKYAFRSEIRRRALLSLTLDRDGSRRREYVPLYNRTGGQKECAYCGTLALHMQKCSGCRTAYSCSETCQKSAWKAHRDTCDPDFRIPQHMNCINILTRRD